jgi:hypothetical protein
MLKSCKLRSRCRCGSTDGLIAPGTGPHWGRLTCWECGKFVRWLNKRDYNQAKKLDLINDSAELEAIAG